MYLAVPAISLYRRYVSPHKGFRCAYAVARGRGSCSDVGLRLAARVSFPRFLVLMSLQARRCRLAYATLQSADPEREWADKEREVDKDAERTVLRCCESGAVSGCLWP